MRQATIALGLAVVLVVLIGCGGPGTAPTAKVTGTLTHNGQPVDGAMVTFIPEKGRPASGSTNSSGKFVLSTFGSGDGAVPGKHAVTVTESYEDKPPPMPGMPGAEGGTSLPSRFPAIYADPKTTPLSVTVEARSKNEFPLEIQD